MCVCILTRQTIERVCLHHHDKAHPDFEVLVGLSIVGPTGTLATAGTKNSQSVFWAINLFADGVGVTGLIAGGVVEEEAVQD